MIGLTRSARRLAAAALLALFAAPAAAATYQLDIAVNGARQFSLTFDDEQWVFSSSAMMVTNSTSGRYFTPGDTVGKQTSATLRFWDQPSPALWVTATDDLGYDLSYYSRFSIFSPSSTDPVFTPGTYELSTSRYLWPMNTVMTIAEVAPVPEPGEWAMLLAGLGLVGFVARRRAA